MTRGREPGSEVSAKPPAGTTAAAGPPAITIRDVTYQYPNGTQALGGVSLEVAKGETIGVVGPSGCGKSTLLSVLAGLARPTQGSLSIVRYSRQRHHIGMMFQKDTLLPWRTVADNVALYWAFHRSLRREAAARVPELLEMVGLAGFAGAYPHELSGGMRRRVAFLASIAAKPEILLLDEPFSALDEPTRVSILDDVFKILREFQMTAVLVTHDLAEAVSMSDRVAILTSRPGRVRSVHAVPFGNQRSILEIRQESEFLKLYGSLWHELSIEIEKSRS